MRWPIVCFDLDGTLCDTREGIVASLEHTISSLGLTRPARPLDRFIGPPLQAIYADGFGLRGDAVQRAVDAYREFYVAGAMFLNTPYPGVPALLEALSDAGARCCVCTAKPWVYAEQILERHGLRGRFEFVSGPELDGTRHTKPEIIGHALAEIGAEPGPGVVMIGDRHYDLDGARALRVDGIGVTWGFGDRSELEAAKPRHLCDDAKSLGDLLLPSRRGSPA